MRAIRVLLTFIFVPLTVASALAGRADAASLPVDSAPPCIYEDGSTQRSCVWVAPVRGNERGRSFVMTKRAGEPRAYTTISNRKARKMVKRWRDANCLPMTLDDDGYPYTTCTGWRG